MFRLRLPEESIFQGTCDPDLTAGKTGRAIAEGHWVMLPPLKAGEHVLTLHGAGCDPATGVPFFETGVTYRLNVLRGKDR